MPQEVPICPQYWSLITPISATAVQQYTPCSGRNGEWQGRPHSITRTHRQSESDVGPIRTLAGGMRLSQMRWCVRPQLSKSAFQNCHDHTKLPCNVASFINFNMSDCPDNATSSVDHMQIPRSICPKVFSEKFITDKKRSLQLELDLAANLNRSSFHCCTTHQIIVCFPNLPFT